MDNFKSWLESQIDITKEDIEYAPSDEETAYLRGYLKAMKRALKELEMTLKDGPDGE